MDAQDVLAALEFEGPSMQVRIADLKPCVTSLSDFVIMIRDKTAGVHRLKPQATTETMVNELGAAIDVGEAHLTGIKLKIKQAKACLP